MRYLAAVLIAPLALAELVVRLSASIVLCATIVGVIVLVENPAMLLRPTLPDLLRDAK